MLRRVSFAPLSAVLLLAAPAAAATPEAGGRGICTPPPTPANLVATPNGNNRIDLAWDAVAGAESYAVYRSLGACPGGTWLPIALNVATNAWSDLYVPGGQTISYTVAAFDADEGCLSPQSTCDDATGTGPCPTPGPAELIAPVNGISGVVAQPSLYWEPDPFASSFDIEIDDDPEFTSAVYTNVSSINNHQTTVALPSGILLYWRVRSDNGCGMGANSTAHRFLVNSIGAPISECFDVNLPIPDNDPGGISDTQSVASFATIGDLDVRIVMQPNHTFAGDLVFELAAGGELMTLVDRPGYPDMPLGCPADFDDVILSDEAPLPIEHPTGCSTASAVIAGTYSPYHSLDTFLLHEFHGDWTLIASDVAPDDIGTIDGWCLIYSPQDPMPFLDAFELGDMDRWSESHP